MEIFDFKKLFTEISMEEELGIVNVSGFYNLKKDPPIISISNHSVVFKDGHDMLCRLERDYKRKQINADGLLAIQQTENGLLTLHADGGNIYLCSRDSNLSITAKKEIIGGVCLEDDCIGRLSSQYAVAQWEINSNHDSVFCVYHIKSGSLVKRAIPSDSGIDFHSLRLNNNKLYFNLNKEDGTFLCEMDPETWTVSPILEGCFYFIDFSRKIAWKELKNNITGRTELVPYELKESGKEIASIRLHFDTMGRIGTYFDGEYSLSFNGNYITKTGKCPAIIYAKEYNDDWNAWVWRNHLIVDDLDGGNTLEVFPLDRWQHDPASGFVMAEATVRDRVYFAK